MDGASAIVLVIGDELLEGHTLDTNSHRLGGRLRERGIRVVRREVLPDDVNQIDRALRRALAEDRPTFVFVVGGIGPTPDDRTYEAVARALGRPLELTPEARAWMDRAVRERSYAEDLWRDPKEAEALLRMVRLPQGSKALRNPTGLALGCAAPAGGTTVFVLPGVPRELDAMLADVVEPEFLAHLRPREVTREIEVRGEEARLFALMTRLGGDHPAIRLGSYPQERGRVVVRVSGPSDEVDLVMGELAKAIPNRTLAPTRS